MRRSPKNIIFITICTLLSLTACRQGEEINTAGKTDLPPIKVEIYEVSTISVADQVEIMGTVKAAKSAVISTRISGNIIDISVIPGSQVKKGQTLVEINAGEISAKLLQAKAELDKASRNLQREQKLLAQSAATPEAVKAFEDIHKIAHASFKEAQIMLSYTTISAPFDGQITKKLVDVGELASPGTPLLHLEDEKNLQVIADVPETIAHNIDLGMKMQISIPTIQLTTEGEVSEIAPASDPLTRTVPIKLNIARSPSLRSGQFARVTLPGTTVETLIVPGVSILAKGQLERVYLADTNRARLRLIRTGKIYPQGVEVLSGLSPGDRLIIRGAEKVKDGQRIVFQ